MYSDEDSELFLSSATFSLALANRLSEQGNGELARQLYLSAIRHGLIVRHLSIHKKIGEQQLQRILQCDAGKLLESLLDGEEN